MEKEYLCSVEKYAYDKWDGDIPELSNLFLALGKDLVQNCHIKIIFINTGETNIHYIIHFTGWYCPDYQRFTISIKSNEIENYLLFKEYEKILQWYKSLKTK